MQTLFFMFSIFLSTVTLADTSRDHIQSEPQALHAGVYQFLGNYKIAQSAVQEIVDRKNMTGEARYQQLIQQGYGCAFKSNMVYLCKKFVQLEKSNVLSEKVNKKYAQQRITVGDQKGSAELLDTNEEITQWKIIQPVEFVDMAFNDYVLVRKPNYWGAWLTREVYRKAVQIISENEIQQSDEFWITQGSANLIYYVQVVFEK